MSEREEAERAERMGRVCSPKRRAVERIPAVTSSDLSWEKGERVGR